MALEESETTFTRARLESFMSSQSALMNGFKWRVNDTSDLATRAYLRSSASSQPDFNPKVHIFPSSDEASKLYSSLIDNYTSLVPDLNRLDECFFEDLIETNLWTNIPDHAGLDDTISLLQRLPRVPIEFHDCETDPSYSDIDDFYFSDTITKSWETLKAASLVSTTVLSLALTSRSRNEEGGRVSIGFEGTDLCREVGRLIDEVIRRSRKLSRTPLQLFILRTYLWNIWQRTMMLRNNSFLGTIIA
jgi:hypothetical protein